MPEGASDISSLADKTDVQCVRCYGSICCAVFKHSRIIDPSSSTRKERAKTLDYWQTYQQYVNLFGRQQGTLPHKQISSDYKLLIRQAQGSLSSSLARLSAQIG